MNIRGLFGAISCVLLLAAMAGCTTPYTPKEVDGKTRYHGLRELRLESGIYQIALQIPATRQQNMHQEGRRAADMILLFAAELSLENSFEKFVLLATSRELRNMRRAGKLRDNVVNGKLNDLLLKSINIRVRGLCQTGACNLTRSTYLVAVMMHENEAKSIESFDAKEIIRNLRPKFFPR